jgi:hypothetical protein
MIDEVNDAEKFITTRKIYVLIPKLTRKFFCIVYLISNFRTEILSCKDF